ncbi:hypothetical protein AgCh_011787 [Apium graveolens]
MTHVLAVTTLLISVVLDIPLYPIAVLFFLYYINGETKRKFESVHSGGTMSTPDAGKISQYWHCCGSEDPFDPGCTAAPHFSYDD